MSPAPRRPVRWLASCSAMVLGDRARAFMTFVAAGQVVVSPGDGQSFVSPKAIPFRLETNGPQDVCVAVNGAAETCLKNVTHFVLENVPVGAHVATVRSAAAEGTAASVGFVVEAKRRDVFEASYEWRDVGDGEAVPPGCEIRLPLDGESRKAARIPDVWRLQHFVEEAGGFWRTDVNRRLTVADIEQSLQRFLEDARPGASSRRRPRLAYNGGKPLHPRATVQEIDLFRHQRDLTLTWEEEEPPPPDSSVAE